jgi:hypothetical protein
MHRQIVDMLARRGLEDGGEVPASGGQRECHKGVTPQRPSCTQLIAAVEQLSNPGDLADDKTQTRKIPRRENSLRCACCKITYTVPKE